MKKSGIDLKDDTLVFSNESHIEPIQIPNHLEFNKEYVFRSQSGFEIRIKRINFTDLEFELLGNDIKESGIASLLPTFYLGAETIGTAEREFWVSVYNVSESKFVNALKIGNQGLLDEKKRELYLFVDIKEGSGFDNLKNENELWKLKN